MNWKGHIGLGVCFMGLLYIGFLLLDGGFAYGLHQNALIGVPMLFIAIPVGLLASILPDSDIRTSKAYAIVVVLVIAFVWGLVIFGKMGTLMALMALTLSMLALLIPSHRGMFHTVLFALVFGLAMGFVFQDWRIGAFTLVGGLSHLAGDR